VENGNVRADELGKGRGKMQGEGQLHLISTGRQDIESLAAIAKVIHPYLTAMHVRERSWSARELWHGIKRLLEVGVPRIKLVVNDRADVAIAACTGGIHLPHHGLPIEAVKRAAPGCLVGASAHSVKECCQLEAAGADYVIFGTVFETASKPNARIQRFEAGLNEIDSEDKTGSILKGIQGVSIAAAAVKVPLIAIGGIKPQHVQKLLRAGAAGVAVMSGILEAPYPLKAAIAYADELNIKIQGGCESDRGTTFL
jgi:thiazole tautomerase (transcriptional regulator TenI)